MSQQSGRLCSLITLLENKPYASLEALQAGMEKRDYRYSIRTLQRDIQYLRYSLDIEVTWDATHKGYIIVQDNSPGLQAFLRFREAWEDSDLILGKLAQHPELRRFIEFNTQSHRPAPGLLDTLLLAFQEKKMLEIYYQRFQTDKPTVIRLLPGLLKEYHRRWYLIGLREGKKGPTVLGVERIQSVSLLGRKTRLPNPEDIKEEFASAIGVTLIPEEPEEIILNIETITARYLETQPLHVSQTLIEKNKDFVILKLQVIINPELIQEILKWGSKIKVISPPELLDTIRKEVELLHKAYSSAP
jgi:predicted DNA-binding transcriptional regulator YafY